MKRYLYLLVLLVSLSSLAPGERGPVRRQSDPILANLKALVANYRTRQDEYNQLLTQHRLLKEKTGHLQRVLSCLRRGQKLPPQKKERGAPSPTRKDPGSRLLDLDLDKAWTDPVELSQFMPGKSTQGMNLDQVQQAFLHSARAIIKAKLVRTDKAIAVFRKSIPRSLAKLEQLRKEQRKLLTRKKTLARKATQSGTRLIPIKPISIKPGSYILGRDMTGTIPKKAFSCKIDQVQLLFWDLNGDGRLETDGPDGMAMIGINFIVKIPPVLLLPMGQLQLSFPGGNCLSILPLKLGLPESLVAASATMTPIRLRVGLPPLLLDQQASEDCRTHCEYLQQNGISQFSGMSLHDEVQGNPGYTVRGAKAGKGSNILPMSSGLAETINWCALTIWHAAPLFSPCTTRFGVATHKGLTMVYPLPQKKCAGARRPPRVRGYRCAPLFRPAW